VHVANSVSSLWVICSLLGPSGYYDGFKDPKVSKQGTAGKRKHVTLTILQKPEIIRRLENDDSHRGCDFMQHWTNL